MAAKNSIWVGGPSKDLKHIPQCPTQIIPDDWNDKEAIGKNENGKSEYKKISATGVAGIQRNVPTGLSDSG